MANKVVPALEDVTPEQPTAILVLNSGSSSLKFGLFLAPESCEATGVATLVLEGSASRISHADGAFHIRTTDGRIDETTSHIMENQSEVLGKLAAVLHQLHLKPASVGHRVVHGGPNLRVHQRITPAVLQQLEAATHFAPLHIPQSIALIRQAQSIFCDVPHFACFDNAFHRLMPPIATRFPIPVRYEAEGVIRYGFHGLSYESIVSRLGEKLPSRAIFAHLGSGSSLCAVREGQSIDTTMGLTPLGGIPMGSRSGDLDPGILLYLMRKEKLDADQLETLLNHDCGLAGLVNGETDMQILLQQAERLPDAQLAIDIFCTAIRKVIGAYTALLGGVDLLVFTGGIGSNSAQIRQQVCDGLAFLGINPDNSNGKVLTLPAEEEFQIARHCRLLMANEH